jgi:hypothetical protein
MSKSNSGTQDIDANDEADEEEDDDEEEASEESESAAPPQKKGKKAAPKPKSNKKAAKMSNEVVKVLLQTRAQMEERSALIGEGNADKVALMFEEIAVIVNEVIEGKKLGSYTGNQLYKKWKDIEKQARVSCLYFL